jgi:exodeoxyribonuclease III
MEPASAPPHGIIEAAVEGVLIASLYLPNGNPWPGPKFDYKLAWSERLIAHAASLVALDAPVFLAGDQNVVPTGDYIYNSRSWKKNALLQPQSRAAFARLLDQDWTDACANATRTPPRPGPSGSISVRPGSGTRACGSTPYCSTPRRRRG